LVPAFFSGNNIISYNIEIYIEIVIRFSLSFLKGEGVPNRYAIKAKEVSPEILSTSTKPYYIPFYYMPPRSQCTARNYKKSSIFWP